MVALLIKDDIGFINIQEVIFLKNPTKTNLVKMLDITVSLNAGSIDDLGSGYNAESCNPRVGIFSL